MDLVERAAHLGKPAEMLQRARREDAVEGRVLVVQIEGVHVLHDEPPWMPRRAVEAAGVRQHRGRGGLLPLASGEVQIGGEHAPDEAREVEQRRLVARAYAEQLGVLTQGARGRERAHGHRDLPVLAVLAAVRERRAAPRGLDREDVADDPPQPGIAEVLEVAELVVRYRSVDRGTICDDVGT
jgi:hypothetical protein